MIFAIRAQNHYDVTSVTLLVYTTLSPGRLLNITSYMCSTSSEFIQSFVLNSVLNSFNLLCFNSYNNDSKSIRYHVEWFSLPFFLVFLGGEDST